MAICGIFNVDCSLCVSIKREIHWNAESYIQKYAINHSFCEDIWLLRERKQNRQFHRHQNRCKNIGWCALNKTFRNIFDVHCMDFFAFLCLRIYEIEHRVCGNEVASEWVFNLQFRFLLHYYNLMKSTKQVLISIIPFSNSNCYLMNIQNGMLVHILFLLSLYLSFVSKNPKFMLSSWANVIDKIMRFIQVMSNIFETPCQYRTAAFLGLNSFCRWREALISDMRTQSAMTSTFTHAEPNFNPSHKVISNQFNSLFTPSVLIFFSFFVYFFIIHIGEKSDFFFVAIVYFVSASFRSRVETNKFVVFISEFT